MKFEFGTRSRLEKLKPPVLRGACKTCTIREVSHSTTLSNDGTKMINLLIGNFA